MKCGYKGGEWEKGEKKGTGTGNGKKGEVRRSEKERGDSYGRGGEVLIEGERGREGETTKKVEMGEGNGRKEWEIKNGSDNLKWRKGIGRNRRWKWGRE